jgi:hypothetical protein
MENLGLSSSHSRAQAIEDRGLIDATPMAKRAGFKYPVFITANLWEGYIDPAPQLQHENTISRLWDTLTDLAAMIESTKNPGSCIWFTVSFQMYIDGKHIIRDVKLKSTLSPGGDAVPMITIMLPDENGLPEK